MPGIAEKTVREIALGNAASVRVFETLGIDYCCGGRRSLPDAFAQANVPLERALELLAAAAEAPEQPETDWASAPLSALTAEIVGRHHAFVGVRFRERMGCFARW